MELSFISKKKILFENIGGGDANNSLESLIKVPYGSLILDMQSD